MEIDKLFQFPPFQSAVLVWDPSSYNASVQDWYNKPDWPFFEQFFSKRLMKPEDSLYLLHPGKIRSECSQF